MAPFCALVWMLGARMARVRLQCGKCYARAAMHWTDWLLRFTKWLGAWWQGTCLHGRRGELNSAFWLVGMKRVLVSSGGGPLLTAQAGLRALIGRNSAVCTLCNFSKYRDHRLCVVASSTVMFDKQFLLRADDATNKGKTCRGPTQVFLYLAHSRSPHSDPWPGLETHLSLT